MDEHNPYEAPTSSATGSLRESHASQPRRGVYLAWVSVFLFNLAVPFFLGWSMTGTHGRIGLSLAVILLLTSGCWVCTVAPKLGKALIVGGVVVGLAQLFPVLQIFAGMASLAVGEVLGLVDAGGEVSPPGVRSEFGGFIATIMTGGILMAVSVGIGATLRRLFACRVVDGCYENV